MSAPQANAAAPTAPTTAAQDQAPAPAVPQAPPTQGAAQPQTAAPARRSRAPRGPVPTMKGSPSSGAPALLELAAAVPMHTHQRRAANFFVPDANFMFHVLGICDGMMGSTHRFLQSSPAWLPIVSQLYVSVLWLYQILTIYAHTGYGLQFANLLRAMREILRIDECLVPGPLVPFFESLAAVNGPFDWIGDVTSAIPDLTSFWNEDQFVPVTDYLRSVPIPAVLLDQLAYFATWTVPANQTLYGNFEWFRNIFSQPAAVSARRMYRLGPYSTGSLFATDSQVNAARSFWNPAFQGFNRVNSTGAHLVNWEQIFGFVSTAGEQQIGWYQHVAIVMQKYSQYFNGSKALKDISPVGVGAVLIYAQPQANADTRNWLYPTTFPGPFLSSRFHPNHEIPSRVALDFMHADHDIEEIAEQYAILCSTNIMWSENNASQGNFTAIHRTNTHVGDYWTMMTHREVSSVNLKAQYAQIIASRYHQVTALRSE